MTKAGRVRVDIEKDENKGATVFEKKWEEVAPDSDYFLPYFSRKAFISSSERMRGPWSFEGS